MPASKGKTDKAEVKGKSAKRKTKVAEQKDVQVETPPQKKENAKKTETPDWQDKYLRLHAEIENIRKRQARDRELFVSLANEELILSLLPVLDDFRRARQAWSGKDPFPEGILLIEQKMFQVLEKRGVKRIEVKAGDVFDSTEQEAVSQVPSKEQKGKIVDIVEEGYRLGEKIIRFVKVVIGT